MTVKSALIVDDHVAIRSFWTTHLQVYLGLRLEYIDSSYDAISYLKNHKPDFISLDLQFEGEDLNYLNLASKVRALAPNAIIYVYTSEGYPQILYDLKEFVNGIALKSDHFDEVFELVKLAIENPSGRYLSKSVQERISLMHSDDGGMPELSTLDMKVLHYILEGYSSQEMAKALIKAEKTVEVYRRQLRSKFKVDSNIGLVKKAVRLRYDEYISQKLKL